MIMRKFTIFAILFLLVSYFEVDAQCAMCKENVASALEAGANGDMSASFGAGLNDGILYLMVIPYIFLMSILWIVFKKRITAFFQSKFSRF